MKNLLLLSALVCSAAACAHSRSQAVYAADTSNLLASRNDQLQACYNAALQTQPNAAGIVTVKFAVVPTSGEIKEVTIDPTHTTAPEALDKCVLEAMNGLALAPSDRNEGRATFSYEFKLNPPAAPAQPVESAQTSS